MVHFTDIQLGTCYSASRRQIHVPESKPTINWLFFSFVGIINLTKVPKKTFEILFSTTTDAIPTLLALGRSDSNPFLLDLHEANIVAMTSILTLKKRWQLSRHVDAVVSAGGGNAVAATSQLTGSVWDGRVHGLMGAGQIEAEIEVDAGIADLCCLDEGQFIAGCDDGSVRVVHSGGVLPLPGGHNANVASVAVSSEKKLVASGGHDRAVLCWNLNEPSNEPMRFEGHIDSVNSVDWNDVGDNLLTASSDGMGCVWDERQNHWSAAITIPTGMHVYSAVFAGGGSTVVMSTEMMDIVAFDIRASAKPMWRKSGYKGIAHCLRTSPHKESIVAIASNCPAVTLIDVAAGKTLSRSFHHTDYVRSVAWDPQEETRLFSGSWDKSVVELAVNL